MEPLQGVIITSREIYDAVVRLTGRVDVLIEQHSEVQKDIQDHENRIRILERGRWPIPAVSLVISLIAVGWTVVTQLNIG